ncbi:MAG: peptidoglycan-associated lipoprotein Pal [Geminicoccales bacterium]
MAGSLRMFAPLGMLAALVLLGGCSSDDMSDGSGAGGAGSGGAAGDAAGGGISSSALAGQPVPGTQEDLEVTVGDRVFFAYDSAVLSPIATQTLDRQGAWLKQYPDIVLTVEGHTDERGTREYNLALADRRANAVRNYLVALGVQPSRILTISYGEERPAEPGDNETAWAKNRRAVSVVSSTVN